MMPRSLVGKPEYVLVQDVEQSPDPQRASMVYIENNEDETRFHKSGRPKKTKIREVKAEVQTGILLYPVVKTR